MSETTTTTEHVYTTEFHHPALGWIDREQEFQSEQEARYWLKTSSRCPYRQRVRRVEKRGRN